MKLRTALLVVIVGVSAGVARSAPETSFNVQARVTDAGAPADGFFDVEAALYDNPTGCCQVGTTIHLTGIEIVDGVLSADLDFGSLPTDALWLELGLRPSGGPSYTTLDPRFGLDPAPLAMFAREADETEEADDATTLGGLAASSYKVWANHTGVPGDLLDGDDDTLADLSCASGQVAVWSSGAWTCGDDSGARYVRTHVVAPVGDPLANGAALLAAMAAIPTPTAAGEARLLKIEPGRYDLGASTLEMKPWVDVEGSGQLTTVIASVACNLYPTVELADDCELRNLTVENSCAESTGYGDAVHGSVDRARVSDLIVRAVGACDSNSGADIQGSDLEIRRVTAIAHGASNVATGIDLYSMGGGVVENLTARAEGGRYTFGAAIALFDRIRHVDARGSLASVTNEGAVIESTGFVSDVIAVGAEQGLYLAASSAANLDVRSDSTGIFLQLSDGETKVVRNSTIDGGIWGVEVYSYNGGGTLELENTTISSSGYTVRALGGSTIRVAASRLLGGPILGTGVCAGVSDESHTFYASTCPP